MAESGTYDPETVARHQRIADTLLLQAAKPREIRSRLQGAGQLGEGLLAGLQSGWADKEQKDARKEAIAQALAAYSAGPSAAAPPTSAGPDPSTPTTTLVGSNPDYGPTPRSPAMATVAGTEDTIPLPQRNPLGALNPEFRSKFADLRTAAGDKGAYFDAPEQGSIGNVRSPQQQLALYAQGRTAPGPIVTGTPNSNHITGKALDVVPTGGTPESKIGSVVSALMANDPRFAGMRSGATFSNLYDPLHVELNKPQGTQVASLNPSSGVQGVAGALSAPAPTAAPQQDAAPPAPVQVAQALQQAPQQQGNREAQIRAAMNPWTPPAVASSILGQITPHPQAMKITNRDGSESVVFVDPVNGTVKDQSGKPVSTSGASLGGQPHPEMSGEDFGAFLKKTDPGRANLIEQMHNGELAPAQMGRYGTKAVQALLEDAARIYPDFNQIKWEGAVKAQRELSSASPSALGGRIQSLKNSVEHLANASDAAVKLGNVDAGNYLLSAPINKVMSTTTGNQDLINKLNSEAQIYGGERTKFLTGRAGTEDERMGFQRKLGADTAAKPAMAGAIEGEITQLEDAVHNQEDQLKQQASESWVKKYPIANKEVQDGIARIKKNIEILRGKKAEAEAVAQPTASGPDPAALAEAKRRGLIK